ncbi:hypothetical protein KFL_000300200 [Klebsormidium nitens]|uniref:Uncharacterized protein n=1 Tax=Klebsormidium nitens TaxID=105231 RepID=A0A0U9HI69_KLENI|nr:hypothetical protein KFL_000300200 [Klebsormidium nitens]|eukprot:GAQ79422.1 hypothetical protein KFL_000300200 [Klebsormidium nitens]
MAMSTACLNLALNICIAPLLMVLSVSEFFFPETVKNVKDFIVIAMRPDLENEVRDRRRPSTREMLLRIQADLRELKSANRSEPELHQIHELLKRTEEREAHVRDLLKKGWSREDMMVGALAQTKERLKREFVETRRQGKKVDELLQRLESSVSTDGFMVESGSTTPISRAGSSSM